MTNPFSLTEASDTEAKPFKHRLTTVSDFAGLQELYRKLNERKEENKEEVEWVFRGHRATAWRLETTLDRVFKKLDPDNKLELKDRLTREGGLVRRFTRQSHHYL